MQLSTGNGPSRRKTKMTVNETQTDETLDEVFSYLVGKLTGAATPAQQADPVKEYQRLLAEAEEEPDEYRANRLIQIADRHLRLIEIGLASQK